MRTSSSAGPDIRDLDDRRPERLLPGSRVTVVAPSSGVLEPSLLQRGARVLEDLGLQVTLAPGVRSVRGYLAGEDQERADDLLSALADEAVDAVWCARGGYGAQRTVAAALGDERLDTLAGVPPKVFVGFSDVTVLHSLLGHRFGWVTFYGPMLTSLVRASSYTLASLRSALFEAAPYEVGRNPDDPWVTTVVPGAAEAPLAGGCLKLLAAIAGTPLQVDFAGRIAFFEDVDETPLSIDRSLSQLLAAGCFEGCLGIVIGEHVDVEATGGNSLGLEQVFADLLEPLGVPCCFGLPLGHGKHLATLPIGVSCRVDADAGSLTLLEAGVR